MPAPFDPPPPPGAPCAVVLGGTGWVGRHICAGFARVGYRVLAVARTAVARPAAHGFRSLDLVAATEGELSRLLSEARPQVVVNATDAANATDGWERTEAQLYAAHVEATERLIRALAPLPWRPRLVHIGTVHEYGPVEPGTSVRESARTRPVNAYARTKLLGSQAVLRAARAGAVEGVVLRLVNVCGPGPSPASFPGKLLALLREAAAGGAVTLTVADSRRDWLDVRDAAAAALPAARLPVSGHVVNLGSGVAVPTRELVALARTAADLPPGAVAERENRENTVRSLGGDWIRADIRLAAQLLGWQPRISLAQSLRDMWAADVAPAR